jgi:hypothetical protein
MNNWGEPTRPVEICCNALTVIIIVVFVAAGGGGGGFVVVLPGAFYYRKVFFSRGEARPQKDVALAKHLLELRSEQGSRAV